jgi:hypothetical protein
MSDLYLVDFGGEDSPRGAEREAEQRRMRARWSARLATQAGLTDAEAEKITSIVFDHFDQSGQRCLCGCHPRLDAFHDGGWDCPCTWDEQRCEHERKSLAELIDGPVYDELRSNHDAEEAAIAAWLAAQVEVTARRMSSFAPEQWEGVIDGLSFYFRERHGQWRIEIDVEPTGEFANRLVSVEDGEAITEPVPIERGEVIAEGLDTELGSTPVEHLAHIVRTVRRHLGQEQCTHPGAVFYCPLCGAACEP